MKRILIFTLIFILGVMLCGCSGAESALSGAISENSELRIPNGKILLIDDKVVCENGGSIMIESGGAVVLNGEIELRGDMYVEGQLQIAKKAKIYGTGTIHVINSFDDIICSGTVTAKIKAPEPVNADGVTYVGGILVVNKRYSIPNDYGNGLSDELRAAVVKMREDSGYPMKIVSGFRDYETQKEVYKSWCELDGIETASTYSAKPGHCEHQTGLAVDITSTENDYAFTDEARWIGKNCYKYGLIVRYPEDKFDETGYIYEPWHLRYVGKSTAKLIHDSGLTLEEFLGISG
ncbi:MAG: D-alanyl-D-alanine carboxypeptidase family protein [Oscillospiraceae bacterium]|nr:D-alanyl-D-alanine carboxypeptidase family protein [Oscillospiraceae bacterium]